MTLTKLTLMTLVLLLVSTRTVWSFSQARLLGLSESGQTALLNLGVHDGVVEGDFAIILKEVRDISSQELRIVPVAKARNVKINRQNSIWILYQILAPELLKKGEKYILPTESQMLAGRRDPRLGRIKIVTESDKSLFQTSQFLKNDQDRLAKLSQLYPELEVIRKNRSKNNYDVELLDIHHWTKIKNENHSTAIIKSSNDLDFKRSARSATFEKMVDGIITWKTTNIKAAAAKNDASSVEEVSQLDSDMSDSSALFNVNLFANPVSFAVWNNQKSVNLGYQVSTLNSEVHEFNHDFSYNLTSSVDETFGTRSNSLNVFSSLIYDFNRFYGKWSYFSMLSYEQSKLNDVYSIKDQYGLGIAGLKYSFIRDGKYFRRLNISYIPIIESASSDENLAFPGEEPKNKIVNIRHSFRIKADANIDIWNIRFSFFYRPNYYYDSKILDLQDINLRSELSISRPITRKLSASYNNTYTYDIRQLRSQQVRPDNTIHSFSLNYIFDI